MEIAALLLSIAALALAGFAVIVRLDSAQQLEELRDELEAAARRAAAEQARDPYRTL